MKKGVVCWDREAPQVSVFVAQWERVIGIG
jgi:hypothetical protein